ncbi:tetraspanin-8 isoform X1 [Selaginella moellendorffii]|nr:tetraspanin-8 isoform X1 [Selaginella moellendorffii]|eukprot:XP_002970024.2 tetraspanin-8 isoform X1 [Selaginella moellendorffii]
MVAHSYPRPYARWPGAADAKAGHFCRASVRECSRRFQPDRSIDLMGLTSNYLTGILNFAAMILSLAVIGAGIWLAHRHETVCVKFLQFPVIALGLFILLVSLAGFIGSCFRIAWLLWIYLLVMLLLILALLAFTAFAFVVTSRGGARHSLAGLGYEEYRLTDYSPWLQDRVKNPGNWAKIKSCLIAARVCVGLEEATFTNYSPLQSGCCRPPAACGFANATSWADPQNPNSDPDCSRWNQEDLCLDCDSCKAGVLENIKRDWRKVAFVSAVMFFFLVIVYSVGCCAFRNARKKEVLGF